MSSLVSSLVFIWAVSGINYATAESLSSRGVFPDGALQQYTSDVWKLSNYNHPPKLFTFWATWCPYCRRLFPSIQALHEQYAADGLTVVAISVRDDGDTLAYARKHGLTMDVLINGDPLVDQMGVPGTPVVVLLNGDNRVVFATPNSDPTDSTLRNAVHRRWQPMLNTGSPVPNADRSNDANSPSWL